MLKSIVYFVGPVLLVILVALAAFWSLKKECSLTEPLVKLNTGTQPNRTNDNSKIPDSSEHNASVESEGSKPSARFNLSVTGPNKIEGHYYAQNADGEGNDWGHKFLCETKVGDFSLAIFTFMLVVFTGLLWFSTDSLVRGAENTAERQLRAYISFTPQSLADAYPNRIPRANFTIKNTGLTPAHNIRYSAILEVLPHPLASNQGDLVAVHSEHPTAGRPIHSNDEIFGQATSRQKMTYEDFEKMIKSNHRLYLAGIIWYEDVFGQETRKTKFCVCVGGDDYGIAATQAFTQRKPIEFPKADWAFSRVHNDAT